MRWWLLIRALAVLLAAGWPVAATGGDDAGEVLERQVRSVLRGAGLHDGDASVTVLGPQGERVVSLEPRRPMKPASNMKLLTTLAALELLGPDYAYETSIRATAPVIGGVVAGDVVLHGTGDPNISGRFQDGDPLRILRTWARRLRELGLGEIRGDLVVDDRFFDDERYLRGWKQSYMGRPFAAEVSPLNLDDNCIDVRIVPGRPGGPARVEATPESALLRVEGAPLTVASGRTEITIHRALDGNELTVRGRIHRAREEWRDRVAVHDPALFFAHTLARVLRDEGIALSGSVRRPRAGEAPGGGVEAATRRAPPDAGGPSIERGAARGSAGAAPTASGAPPSAGAAPADSQAAPPPRREGGRPGALLVEHRSPLRLDLPVINKESQNLHAEVLLKTLGARVDGEGSVAGGGRAIRRFLEGRGIPADELVVADGSGLSHENRVTTGMLAEALHGARRAPWFEVFRESLAVAGRDGTLETRFRADPSLAGRVRAKTGYIAGVSALSGYLDLGDEVLTFSMLFDRLPGGNARIKRVQERILALLAER